MNEGSESPESHSGVEAPRIGIGALALTALLLAGWDAFLVVDFFVFFDSSACSAPRINCVGPFRADVLVRGAFTATALAAATLGGWITLKSPKSCGSPTRLAGYDRDRCVWGDRGSDCRFTTRGGLKTSEPPAALRWIRLEADGASSSGHAL